MTRIAIIGAGMAGLTLARRLSDCATVTVFEKSRGFGGRLATRRTDGGACDHGAQYFTARTRPFVDAVRSWHAAGVVATWPARFVELDRGRVLSSSQWRDDRPRFVGLPGMSALGRHLATGIDVRLRTPVESVTAASPGWQLTAADDADLGVFDWVVTTAPAAQSAQLLPTSFAHHADVTETQMQACFALMLSFAEPLALSWDAARVRNSRLRWVSVNSSKPGRGPGSAVVAHSTHAYADARIDAHPEAIERDLAAELHAVAGIVTDTASYRCVHRWRYANVAPRPAGPMLIDPRRRLAACGDWCIGGRVEAAYTSANDLAAALRANL